MAQQYSVDLLAIYQNAPLLNIKRAHLFMIGPCLNGAMIYATDFQLPITYNGNTYQPTQFGEWTRGEQTIKIGLESNAIDLTVVADEQFIPMYFPGTNNKVYLLDGVEDGLLGGAAVTVYRATMTTPGVVVGPTGGSLVSIRFVGEIGPVTAIGPTKASVRVNDLMYRLNLDCPRMLIQAPCRWVLYSPACTLVQATFTKTGVVAGLVDPRTFSTTAHIVPHTSAGTFNQGQLKFTSGANNGIPYFVSLWTAGGSSDTIQIDTTPLYDMSAGDTFSISQGCDHQFATCQDFQGSNAVLNFGGAPFVPVPETSV